VLDIGEDLAGVGPLKAWGGDDVLGGKESRGRRTKLVLCRGYGGRVSGGLGLG